MLYVGVACLLGLFPASGSTAPSRSTLPARTLTFEERVQAQDAIERVYYSHQTGTTEPFEKVVSRAILENKVRKYLQQSMALERIWSTPVTDEMLHREMERIRTGTRLPGRLAEVSAALGNDPFLLEECFARPVLVDHLARSFFASDERIHGDSRRQAENLRALLTQGGLDPATEHPLRSVIDLKRKGTGLLISEEQDSAPATQDSEYAQARGRAPERVGEIGPVRIEHDHWAVRVVLSEDEHGARIATYWIPRITWDAWWDSQKLGLDPLDARAVSTAGGSAFLAAPMTPQPESASGSCTPADTWVNGRLDDLPEPRSGATAVWTGSVMVVWGGRGQYDVIGTGGRYDPLMDRWSPVSLTNAPSKRSFHTAVWTGQQMIIWGGSRCADPLPSEAGVCRLNDGSRYNPTTDTWSSTAPYGDTGRYRHVAVWTGSRMIIWGGYNGAAINAGYLYDPATNTWTNSTSMVNVPPPAVGATAVWTGTRMLIWGGGVNTGGSFDPIANTWSTITTQGAPSARTSHTAVWTGTKMIVWGGRDSSSLFEVGDGALYDPSSNSWQAVSAGGPSPRFDHTAVWTGDRMIIWGGGYTGGVSNTGARYDPVGDTWTPLTTTNAPAPRGGHVAVWTGNRMVVWGSSSDLSGGRYDPATDTWTPTSVNGVLPFISNHVAIWTGNLMVVAGSGVAGGARYDPLVDSWSLTSTANAPSAKSPTAVWTGTRMIVWGGTNLMTGQALNTGARYDPVGDFWTSVTTTNAPAARSSHTAVWTGSQMVIWGGQWPSGVLPGGITTLNTGGRYDPATNSWSATSTTNAPTARQLHVASWTGSRMIVWGGLESYSSSYVVNTGARYNPTNDTWSPVSTTNAPTPRYFSSGIWTGTQVIVWGGGDQFGAGLNTGGRYNPATDSWLATSTTNAPSVRLLHTAVWTGSRMIVWGGSNAGVTGGRYDPATDSWAPTSTMGTPIPRSQHTAVWTGDLMIVWGGTNANFLPLNSGGAYSPDGQAVDQDGDGYLCDVDCNDGNPSIHPGAAEICDGIDQNCDGVLDDGFPDSDADGYAACGGDCNDANPSVHPGATEICNGIDDNCNGATDEVDADGDGFSACSGDCNDNDPLIHPGATEVCDAVDNDCDGSVDEGFDLDSDGWASCTDCDDANPAVHPGAVEICDGVDENCNGIRDDGFPDADHDGWASCGGDCNDASASVHPGATETCNHADENCNGLFDEGFPDVDADGYAACAGDCNDNDPLIHPGAAERCNGADDDCDGSVDEGFPDADSDGYTACQDCNDHSVFIHPFAFELCDGVDNDCNNIVDDRDYDADGHGACFGDCNDYDPAVWGMPLEVPSLNLASENPLSWSWLDEAPSVGPGVAYDVPSGTLGPGTGVIFPSGSCMGTVSSPGFTDARPDPNPGYGYWFLVRARNSCGSGSYGLDWQGSERSELSCP